MFPMTVTIQSRAELNAVMAALAEHNPYAQQKAIHAEPPAGDIVVPPQAQVQATAGKTKAAAATATPPAESAAAATTAESHSEEPATYSDASAAITKLARTKGRDAAVAVLQAFGAANLKEVTPEQFAAVIAAAKKAMV